MQSCVLKDVILDLLIGGVVQQTGGVQAFQRELDTDGFARYLTLGKADNRLDVYRLRKYIYYFNYISSTNSRN